MIRVGPLRCDTPGTPRPVDDDHVNRLSIALRPSLTAVMAGSLATIGLMPARSFAAPPPDDTSQEANESEDAASAPAEAPTEAPTEAPIEKSSEAPSRWATESSATDAEADTAEQSPADMSAEGPAKDITEAPNPLLPPKEKALVSPHPVDFGKAQYKPGKGLEIESADGRFGLQTRIRAQMRYELHNDREATDDGTVEQELGHTLGLRRARLQFAGHAFNEHNRFKTELAFSPKDLSFKDGTPHRTPLLTWYFEFDYLRDLTFRMGQYKIPFSRQRVISSGNLQLVDRSLANGEYNLDRDIGFDFRSKDVGGLGGYLKYYAGVYMGEGRDVWNTAGDFKLHYLGRIEINPLGKFDDYSESDFARESRPGLSIGAAYSFIDEAQGNRGVTGSAPADGGTSDYHSVTADVMFKWKGWSVSSEFFWRQGTRRGGGATEVDPNDPTMEVPIPNELPRNGIGWNVQSGYLIPRLPLEFAARYSGIRATKGGPGTSISQRDEVGGGVSWYFAQHPLKLQADYFRQWDEGEMDLGSDVMRVQLQLAF